MSPPYLLTAAQLANFALFSDFDAFAFLLYACRQASFRVPGADGRASLICLEVYRFGHGLIRYNRRSALCLPMSTKSLPCRIFSYSSKNFIISEDG